MPSLPIRGARIHYETYGEHRAGVPPALLVHGSYITGSIDWGEVAPMPLMTYADTKPQAAKIKDLVSGKKMPPVIGTPHYAVLTRGEGLTQAEINTLVRWADTGAREGAPAHNKSTPTPSKR